MIKFFRKIRLNLLSEGKASKRMKHTLIIMAYFVVLLNVQAQNIFRTACNGNMVRLDSMLSKQTIEVKDNQGRSLLQWAVACKQKEVFDFLISKGIDINSIDHQGRSAMHVAVQYDNSEYLDYLVHMQPTAEWQSKFGAGLLEIAVMNKNKDIIGKLVGQGIDPNLRNQRGSTPLEISQRIGAVVISDYLISLGADQNLVRVFEMQGAYLGQVKPGESPTMFAPNFISTEEQEFGSVFNKEGTEFYYGVDVGERNEIRFSKMIENRWTQPEVIVSHERYSYNDPFLSNDETRLYFISDRALDGLGEIKDIDIWYAEKIDGSWSTPINAGANINTKKDEYYISFTHDGSLYFASNGHIRKDSSRTDHDIYYAKTIGQEFQESVRLGPAVNTAAYEGDVFVAPDESYLIFCGTREGGFGRGDLYISFKSPDGNWTKSVNMGKEINTEFYEYCPFVTKDGKYLFFTRNQDIYWVSTEVINKMKR